MLLIPGAMGTRWNWAMNIEAFRKVGTPVVVELWGHGRSPIPDNDSDFLVAGYVEQFELLRSELGVARWPVLGQSIGGSLALHYGLACPEVVGAIVFTNDVCGLGSEHERAGTEARRAHWGPILAGPEGRRFLIDHVYNPKQPGPFDVFAPELRAGIVEAYESGDPVAVAKTWEVTIGDLPMRERFCELAMPMLWVHGSREQRTRDLATWAAAVSPTLEIVAVASGHAVNIEACSTYNAFATAFLRRHR